MPSTELDRGSSRFNLSGRAALALVHADVHAQTELHAASFVAVARAANVQVDYVDEITKGATNWAKLLADLFPKSLANGTAALNGFRHYMIQDSTYLAYYYRRRMQAVSKSGSFEDVQKFAEKIFKSLGNVTGAINDCTAKLGVPADVVKSERESDELKKSAEFYSKVVDGTGNVWLDIHIALLPCILGYYTIAKGLLEDPNSIRDTIYYPLWVLAMAYPSAPKDYRTFINGSITPALWTANKTRWINLFNEACQHEIDFFTLGSDPKKFGAYNITASSDSSKTVTEGTFTIRSYRGGNKGYLTPAASDKVTIKESTADAKWDLKNSKDGFTIQNKSKRLFLSVSVLDGSQLSYEVSLKRDPVHWSINSITRADYPPLENVFQLLSKERLQFALDARSVVKDANVVVSNNSQVFDQIWVITKTT